MCSSTFITCSQHPLKSIEYLSHRGLAQTPCLLHPISLLLCSRWVDWSLVFAPQACRICDKVTNHARYVSVCIALLEVTMSRQGLVFEACRRVMKQ